VITPAYDLDDGRFRPMKRESENWPAQPRANCSLASIASFRSSWN